MRKYFRAALVLAAFSALPTHAAELNVDQNHPAAADTNPGTPDHPFKTITPALAAAGPGDVVLVHAGTYRETLEFKKSGAPGKPITLRAATGQRVLLDEADPITAWHKATREQTHANPHADHILVADIAWKPLAIYVDGAEQRLACWPGKDRFSMWRVKAGDPSTVIDAPHLTQPQNYWTGATLTVRNLLSEAEASATVLGFDAEKHALLLDKTGKLTDLLAGKPAQRLYFLSNAVGAISAPGEYAIDASSTPAKIFLWPSSSGDPAKMNIQGSKRARTTTAINWAGHSFITIDGIEEAHGEGNGIGSMTKGGHDIQLLNCFVHDNHSNINSAGFRLIGQSNCLIRHCLSWRNTENGVHFLECKNVALEECDIADNDSDGIDISNSSGMHIVRNVSRRHWYEGHPDAFQCYKGVDDLLVDSNLFLDGGQGWQSECTYNVTCTNNIWCGTHATGLSLSDRPTAPWPANHDMTFDHNTLACIAAGVMNVNLNYHLHDNIFAPGSQGAGLLISDMPWQADRNLFWDNGAGGRFKWAGKQVGGFPGYQALGQDQHGKLANPKFKNAPQSFFAGDRKKSNWYDAEANQSTAEKLYLDRFNKSEIAPGDIVEINWDDLPRKITTVGDGFIIIDPPLDAPPRSHDFVVANWKNAKNFALDLRLADDSPGKKTAPDASDAGSSINIQAYLQGDFNADGKRDLPPIPSDVPLHRLPIAAR